MGGSGQDRKIKKEKGKGTGKKREKKSPMAHSKGGGMIIDSSLYLNKLSHLFYSWKKWLTSVTGVLMNLE